VNVLELDEIAAKAKAGQEAKTTVRTLLSWFGMYRRTYWNVCVIRDALALRRVRTSPDFEATFIDGIIDIVPTEAVAAPVQGSVSDGVSVTDSVKVAVTPGAPVPCPVKLADPAHRISRLASANRAPLFIAPDGTVEQAITLMLRYDYSQPHGLAQAIVVPVGRAL